MKFSEELAEAKKIAVLAGSAVMKIYGKKFEVKQKADKSEVTEADHLSNKIIIDGLKKFKYKIISEECKNEKITGKKTWVVDPLDGTKDFINKEKGFSIMMGLLKNKKPVLGVVYLPALKKLFFAEKGKGAYVEYNSKICRIKTSSRNKIKKYRLILSKHHFTEKEQSFTKFLNTKNFLRVGSTGYKLSIISEGNAEMYFNFDGLWIWDVCAPQAILEEAGGNIFDMSGNELSYDKERFSCGVIATSGKNKKEIVKLIRKYINNAGESNSMEGRLIWITGLAGSGKTTVAEKLYSNMKAKYPNTVHLDGDTMRKVLGNAYTHTIKDRKATAYIYSKLASAFTKQGTNVIVSTISLFHEIHEFNRKHNRNYYEILLDVDMKELLRRNKKNLYKKGKNVMGLHQKPELPKNPTLVLKNNSRKDLMKNVDIIMKTLIINR